MHLQFQRLNIGTKILHSPDTLTIDVTVAYSHTRSPLPVFVKYILITMIFVVLQNAIHRKM